MSHDLKNLSKKDFTVDLTSNDAIKTSCLMRIADALEAMSKPYLELLKDVEFNRNGRRFLTEQNQHLKNKIAGHKAAYTKLKNKGVKND